MTRKKRTFILMILVVVLGGICFSQLYFSPQFSPFGLASNTDIEAYEILDSRFNKDTAQSGSIYILEKSDKWDAYDDFKTLDKISIEFEEILDTNVHSITNLSMPAKGLFGFSQREVLKLNSKASFNRSYQKLQKMDFAKRKFISHDDNYALLFIEGYQELTTAQQRSIGQVLTGKCTGYFYSSSNQKEETKGLVVESALIGFAALLLVLTGFYFMTKSLKGMPLIGLVISFNIAVTFVFMYVFGIPFSMNMIAIPCLLVILSFSDIMHIFHFQATHAASFESDVELRKSMLSKIGWPMIFTSISNLLGFIIFFIISENEMLTQLAVVSVFGVVVAYLSSRFIVVPLIDRETIYVKKSNLSKFGKSFLRSGNKLQAYKKVIIAAVTLLLLGTSFYLYKAFNVDLKVENYVSKSSRNYSSGEILSNHFFGAKSGEVVIRIADPDNVWAYSHQKEVEQIENLVQSVFDPMHLTSTNSLIKRYNQILVNGNPNAYRLMSNLKPEVIWPFVDQLGGKQIVSEDRQVSRIKWGFADKGIPKNLAKFEELERALSVLPTLKLKYKISGKSLLADQSVVHYSKRLIFGLLFAILLSSIFMFIYLKSFRLAFGILLVNAIPLVVCLVLMLHSNIQINPQSLFLLSVLAGLCLDDSIYLMGKRNTKVDELVLFPISVTSVVLGLAFFSLVFSSYIWLQEFSVIFIVGLTLAFLLDVFIFPLFMKSPDVKDGQ